jgi:hypothetical protein
LLYSASVGIAFVWGAFIAGAFHLMPHPIGKVTVLGIAGALLAWGVPFIHERIVETERLTPAMHAISNDLRDRMPADAKVLFVNMPWWNAPANPAFLIGAEGMPIYQHEGAPAWTWIAANTAIRRETTYARHPASLTQDPRWMYGQPGEDHDDAALRQRMLESNGVYAFDYDSPGLRARRVALISPAASTPETFIAVLTEGEARYYITQAEALHCSGRIVLDVGWQRAGDASQPLGVFVHGIDAQGNQALTADKDLLNGVMSLDQLPPAVIVNERRIIALPQGTPVIHSIHLGGYRRNDVARLPASRPDGARLEGDQLTVPVAAAASCE